jgi:hypothetical protein
VQCKWRSWVNGGKDDFDFERMMEMVLQFLNLSNTNKFVSGVVSQSRCLPPQRSYELLLQHGANQRLENAIELAPILMQ